MSKSIDDCLTGKFLYGDDFPPERIEQWFQGEQDAYFEIVQSYQSYSYCYHALHWEHEFRYLPSRRFENVLGIGSAFGYEFDGIREQIGSLTIVDPADGFTNSGASYIKPRPDGHLAFPDQSFDLITCFGVLHHICNVSEVFSEMTRCLAPGGFMCICEPITSMGDWRKRRPGLTVSERGIPRQYFHRMIEREGLKIVNESRHEFRPLTRFVKALGIEPFNSKFITKLDSAICNLLPDRYHAQTSLQKLRPLGIDFVLTK